MENKSRSTKLIKNLAGFCFGVAFLMAIVLFGGIGRDYIPILTAKYIFMGAGALGLILNLVTFQGGKHPAAYNLVYWMGSIIVFAGIIFLQMNWPYGFYILVAGIAILGVSFFVPAALKQDEGSKNSDLLDN